MKELGRYDTDLQMFVEKPHELDQNKLEYHRYLANAGYHADDMYSDKMIEEATKRDAAALGEVRAKLAEHVANQGDY